MAIIDQSYYKKPEGARDRTSAGGVIVRWSEGKGAEVALGGSETWSHYILPKGGVKKRETLEEAARREIEEEIGLIDLTMIEPLDVRERLSFDRKRWITTHYFLFIASNPARMSARQAELNAEWFPLVQLPPMLWPEQQELIEKYRDRIEEIAVEYGRSRGSGE